MGTNTGIGIGIGIPFKNNVLGEGKPYLPPEIKDSLKAVVIAYGKTNNDSDRAIVKNLVDASNPFVISNAAFKLNSGYGKYEEDFTSWDRIDASTAEISNDGSKIKCINTILNVQYLFNSINKDIPSFKVKISNFTKGNIAYYYRKEDGTEAFLRIEPSPLDKVIELPKSYNTVENGTGSRGGFYSSNINIGVTIEQIPSFAGAFVTDGVNDLITSTKTVQKMLGGSTEFTAVSMIHLISPGQDVGGVAYTNYIRTSDNYWTSNRVSNTDKTGIYGYSFKQGTPTVINNILGDKNDYTTEKSNIVSDGSVSDLFRANFSVEGFEHVINGAVHASSVAWYWTIIANKVLTTDQINQVIAYFNLDRTLNPDILCNTIKQGITNDNHAEFGDKLIDFSGNGRDIQLNNIAWKGDSGIGKYNFSNINIIANRFEGTVTTNKCHFTKKLINTTSNFCDLIVISPNEPIKFKVSGLSDGRKLFVANKSGSGSNYYFDNGEHEVSLSFSEGVGQNNPFGVTGDIGDIDVTVEFIPSHAGGLCLNGVNDFGKVTGMPVYKDYTFIADRYINNNVGSVASKSVDSNQYGAFIFEIGRSNYSFNVNSTGATNFNKDRTISYLSKYSYNGENVNVGNEKDSDLLWIGTIRDNETRFSSISIYSLMSFPYSMSEFLIERQLKKHKLGTLYPDMVEFRPVIKANNDYEIVYTAIIKPNNWQEISIGDYVIVGESVAIQIKLNNLLEVTNVSSNSLADVSFYKEETGDNVYTIYGRLLDGKSPQKINITIDEYIRFEDIVQPYPVLLRFNDENGNEVSWGGKFKVGSTITRIGSAADSNLLPNIYNIFGLLLNGNQVTSSKVIVEKTMVFKAKSAYIFDNNEPKCILSPRLLRIPNSSYKILGYIPDISGHGNHGKINNSAYAEGSGVNEDGSYQFDGVDDFVTIPTLSSGGKQVLMKVNWNTINSIIYDQRGSGGFAIYCSDYNNPSDSITVPAYKGRNATGTTYIDGIRNEYIIASQLRNVTHNIVEILDTSYAAGKTNPIIGKSHMNSNYGSLALYDFMLFDNISTDDKIKELNEYVGIEAKVELPPYYWDTYGKTNFDADRDSIQQRGVAVGDYDLTNYNHAYEGMSGYNGYPVVFGANKTWTNKSNGYVTSITSNTIHITNVLNAGLALLYSYVKYNGNLQNIKEIPPFKIEIKGLEGRSKFIYKYLATSDATKETNLYLGNGTHELPKSFLPTEALVNDAVVGFSISPIEEGVTNFLSDITIEVLPEYENGLAYDGVSDFTDNKNIPILTDFTFIIKREILGLETNESMLVIKGDKVYNNGIGNAFILEHNSNGVNYVYSYGKLNQIKRDNSKIIYLTPESYNGNPIIKGENGDNLGLVLSRHWRGIIYKTILYSKTMSLLEINFLKNLMERDEIIDLTNPIFIKNE